MDINVLSKVEFEALMLESGITDDNVHLQQETFFISILNTDAVGHNTPYFKQNHENVLVLTFDDVEYDIIGSHRSILAFTQEQGEQLMAFIEKNVDRAQCLVHCSAGISRSGAVGAFISDYTGKKYADFKKTNPYTKPNPTVMRIMNNIWRDKK